MIVGTQTNVRGSSSQRRAYTVRVQTGMVIQRLDRPRAGKKSREEFRADPTGYVETFLATRPKRLRYPSAVPEMVAKIEKWLDENYAADVV